MAPPVKRAAADVKTFNFGDVSAYSSGGMMPEGDYVMKSLDILMHQYTKADGSPGKGQPTLGVMITFLPLAGGEEYQQFYGFGKKAHESWAPNPETGKGIVAVPGGPGIPPNNMTKWAIFHKSMVDSGLPNGILNDDMSVIEGTHVHMANQPEPKEWAGFAANSATGEAAEERKAGTIAVVTEIKDDGKPWEGTGGVPEAKAAAPKANGKPGVAKPAPAKAAAPATEDTEAAAINGVSEVLEKNPNGISKLLLRTGTFKAVNGTAGSDSAQKVINTYFSSDDALNGLLNQVGYSVKGAQVVAN